VPMHNRPRRPFDGRLKNSIRDDLGLDLLRILNERSATPVELAEMLQENLNDVLERIVKLWADSCIEVVAEMDPLGGMAGRRYRITPFFYVDDRKSHDLSTEDREKISATMLQAVFSEAVGALKTGSLDARTDRHLSWLPMRLDEEGWSEVMAMFARTLKEAEAISERCKGRLYGSEAAGVDVIVTMMGFERSESRLPSS
jgi:hypothetical protein